ncbi:MAG: trypsin-like peptidase domain-containing protein [Planctomyces sp.]
MKRSHLLHQLIALLIAFLLQPACHSMAQDAGQQIRSAVSRAAQSVVRIRVIGGEQTVDGNTVSSLTTSGIVLTQAGQILSSSFAFQGRAAAVTVETSSGERRAARLVAVDHVRRLVLLQADGTDWQPPTIVPREQIQVGQHAIALGRFYDSQQPSVSSGIISALNRIHGRAVQTDAKISPVNYGGALIDLSGAVLGILVPLSPRGRGNPSAGIEWYDSGIGFAIPMSDAGLVAARLQAGKDLQPGLAGLQLTAPGPFSDRVSIRRVQPLSPAQKAGIRPGDRLLQAGDRPITRLSSLEEVLAAKYAGDVIELTLQRDGQPLQVSLELVDRIPPGAAGYAGVILPAPSTPENPDGQVGPDLQAMLKPRSQPDTPVLVQTIPGSPAALAGLPAEAELVAVNDKPLKGLRSFLSPDLRLQAGTEISLAWRKPQSGDVQTLKLTAGPLPENVTTVDPQILTETKARTAQKDASIPSREELPIEGLGSCTVILPTPSTGRRPAPVVLLSADAESEAAILQRWGSLLADYQLMLLIPRTPARTPLTADDAPLVLASLQLASSKYSADQSALIVMATAPQTELAWQFASGNSQVTADLVLQSGWVSEFLLQEVSAAGRSVMLLDRPEKTENKLLLERSRSALQNAGFWVPKSDTEQSTELRIANWSVLLRAW